MPTSKNSNKTGHGLSTRTVILFPETTIDPAGAQTLLTRFGRVVLCRPWDMDPIEMEKGGDASLEIIRPAKAMKPEQNLRRVVSEYQEWMRQNPGRGYRAFVDTGHTKDASWDIRQALRLMGGRPHPSGESAALKWHLILHLANAFEESQSEADALLRQMRASGSPLQEAVEDPGDPPGPLSDIPVADSPLWVNDHQIRQLVEAWLGLFAAEIPEDGALVTRHSQVFDYAAGVFEKVGQRDLVSKTDPTPATTDLIETGLTCQTFPVVKESDPQGGDPVIRGLSGQTLILLDY